MRFYFAGRYSRRCELLEKALLLEAITTHTVRARWLHGKHEAIDNGIRGEYSDEQKGIFAQEDLEDVAAADAIVCFTEREGEPFSGRGGRHIEAGYALALGREVIVIGPRENVFYCLTQITHFPTWNAFVERFPVRK